MNASVNGVPCSTVCSNLSFGIVMTVSTTSRSALRPSSACIRRRRPSNANGSVTTATTSAPISRARLAMMGAAPVPVPPPRPVVTNTMSAPPSDSTSFSVSSSAALRPTSGLPPAPRPLVSFEPSCILTGARFSCRAWQSVLAARNCTPSTLDAIMRLTALPPPPPTPTTLISAVAGFGSSNASTFGSVLSGLSSIVIIEVILYRQKTSENQALTR